MQWKVRWKKSLVYPQVPSMFEDLDASKGSTMVTVAFRIGTSRGHGLDIYISPEVQERLGNPAAFRVSCGLGPDLGKMRFLSAPVGTKGCYKANPARSGRVLRIGVGKLPQSLRDLLQPSSAKQVLFSVDKGVLLEIDIRPLLTGYHPPEAPAIEMLPPTISPPSLIQ